MKALTVRRRNGIYLSDRSAAIREAVIFVVLLAASCPAFGSDVQYLPSLYPTGTYPDWSIVADNSINPNSAMVTNATATLVTDPGLSIYNSADWYDAAGTTVSLPSGTLAAGASNVPWGGLIVMGADQWLLIEATFDGVVLDYSGYYESGDPGSGSKNTTWVKVTTGPITVKGTVGPTLTDFTASGASSSSYSGGTWSATWDAPGVYQVTFSSKENVPDTYHWNKVIKSGGSFTSPEPSTFVLVGTGAVSLLAYGRRRRKARA